MTVADPNRTMAVLGTIPPPPGLLEYLDSRSNGVRIALLTVDSAFGIAPSTTTRA